MTNTRSPAMNPEQSVMQRQTVGILIFDDVEVLDFTGPFEVFSVTRLDEVQRRHEPSPFNVLLVAVSDAPVITAGGMTVMPHESLSSCPPLDILVVPGGWGTRRLLDNTSLHEWLRERDGEVSLLTSVCTGSMVLGHAGLLDGRRATTHWRSLDWMTESLPSVTVERDLHVVEDGRVITSAGISAGIDMSLRVVARICGEEIALATARHMEYPYPGSNARRISI